MIKVEVSHRAKNYTKHLAAMVSPSDYDFLKKLTKENNASLGDVVRACIKEFRQEYEKTNNQYQNN